MRATLKNLESAFPGKGAELFALINGQRKTRSYASVRDWERQCYVTPNLIERRLCACNEIAGTHGIEVISRPGDIEPDYEYLNTGDTYALTLLRDRRRGTWIVAAWGDIVERAGRRYA